MLHEKKFAWGWIPPPFPRVEQGQPLLYKNSKPGYSTVNIYQTFSGCAEIFPKTVQKMFSRHVDQKNFSNFSDNFYFSEIFRNIFPANFQRFNFLYIFVFHCLFFRTFESVKVHKLCSWSSYSNVRRSTNPYKERPSTNQNLILFIQHVIKFDLIQFCSSRVFNIAWYFPLGYSHSSITSNHINIFYGFGKMALF